MLGAELRAERRELCTGELRSVIRDDRFGYSELCERLPENLEGGRHRYSGHLVDLRPFRVGVDENQIKETIQGAGEVEMYPLEAARRLRPRAEVGFLGVLLCRCTP